MTGMSFQAVGPEEPKVVMQKVKHCQCSKVTLSKLSFNPVSSSNPLRLKSKFRSNFTFWPLNKAVNGVEFLSFTRGDYLHLGIFVACAVKHLRTSWNCANQLQMSRRGNISDPPPDSS